MLRVEDTDTAIAGRSGLRAIIDASASTGISAADPVFECPYFQSDNAARHRKAVLRLYPAGRAYYCDSTCEQLKSRPGPSTWGYGGFCCERGLEFVGGRALRFRTPDGGETVVEDLVRGKPIFPNSARASPDRMRS